MAGTTVTVNRESKQNPPSVTPPSDIKERAEKLGLLFLEIAPREVSREVLEFIPEETAQKYQMVPFKRDGEILSVAVVNPQDFESLNVLRFLSEKENLSIDTYLVSEAVFQDIFRHYAGTDQALKDAILSIKGRDDEEDVSTKKDGLSEKDKELFRDAPIAKLVEVIIKHALDGKASDVHIEPVEGNYRVRFRVDGVLHSSLVFPVDVGRAVVSRIKILSNLKIDEQRKPQDGRFRTEQGGHIVDLRVSTLPVMEGEKVVMRVLEKTDQTVDFKEMGVWGRAEEILLRKIREPFGIILITGPTGSGKSTSLYSFLKILNQEERNIITLEDPVEYYISGINQSQIKPEIDYTFASGLRSILRQDPNVIMVGEIRDSETAELAIHAALTGHLVLSTLHTNSALGTIPRLVDMGVESFLLASSLQVVAAQRLVRRICLECKEPMPITPVIENMIRKELESIPVEEFPKYGLEADLKKIVVYKGKGCDFCNDTGYKGRVAMVEVIDVTDEVKNIITDKQGSERELSKVLPHQGMISMREDGILKVLAGVTTLMEVERVTEGEEIVEEEKAKEKD
jgi:type IV pilus assembly protein PilB